MEPLIRDVQSIEAYIQTYLSDHKKTKRVRGLFGYSRKQQYDRVRAAVYSYISMVEFLIHKADSGRMPPGTEIDGELPSDYMKRMNGYLVSAYRLQRTIEFIGKIDRR